MGYRNVSMFPDIKKTAHIGTDDISELPLFTYIGIYWCEIGVESVIRGMTVMLYAITMNISIRWYIYIYDLSYVNL